MAPLRKRRPEADTDRSISTAQEGASGLQNAGDNLQEDQVVVKMNPKKKKSKYKSEHKEDESNSSSQSSSNSNQAGSKKKGKEDEGGPKPSARDRASSSSNMDPNDRPMSGYNIFQMEQRKAISQSGETIANIYHEEIKSAKIKGVPSDSNKAILKIISTRWKKLQPMERVEFELMARDANERLPQTAEAQGNQQSETNSSEDFEDMEEDGAEEDEEVHLQQHIPGSISMQHKEAPTAPSLASLASSLNRSDRSKSKSSEEEEDQKMPAGNDVASPGCANLGLLSSAASAVANGGGQEAAQLLASSRSTETSNLHHNHSSNIPDNVSALLSLVNSHLKPGSETLGSSSAPSLPSNLVQPKKATNQGQGDRSRGVDNEDYVADSRNNGRRNLVLEIVQQLLPHLPTGEDSSTGSNGILVKRPPSAELMTRILQNLLASPMDDLLHLINILKLISDRTVRQNNPVAVGETNTNLPSVWDASSGSDPQAPARQARTQPENLPLQLKSDKGALLQQWIQQNYGSNAARGTTTSGLANLPVDQMDNLSSRNGLQQKTTKTVHDKSTNRAESTSISNNSEGGHAAAFLQQYLQTQQAQSALATGSSATGSSMPMNVNVGGGTSTKSAVGSTLDGLLHQMRNQHQLNSSSQRATRTERQQNTLPESQASVEPVVPPGASNPSNAVRDALSKLLASRSRTAQQGPVQAPGASNSQMGSLPSPPPSSNFLATLQQQQQQFNAGGPNQGQNGAHSNNATNTNTNNNGFPSSINNLNANNNNSSATSSGGNPNPGYQQAMQQLLGILQQRQNGNKN